MSNTRDSRSRARAKQELGERLRQVRMELFGEHGGPELARLLGIPPRTWSHSESGVTIPGEVLLDLLDLTCVEPRWLLRGEGAMFRSPPEDEALVSCPPRALTGAGLTRGEGVSRNGQGVSSPPAESARSKKTTPV